jgi:hypothetical protein
VRPTLGIHCPTCFVTNHRAPHLRGKLRPLRCPPPALAPWAVGWSHVAWSHVAWSHVAWSHVAWSHVAWYRRCAGVWQKGPRAPRDSRLAYRHPRLSHLTPRDEATLAPVIKPTVGWSSERTRSLVLAVLRQAADFAERGSLVRRTRAHGERQLPQRRVVPP